MQSSPDGLYGAACTPETANLAVDLANCAKTEAALRELGRQLAFPTWYGSNFDALFDCLSDADWRDGRPTLIALSGLETLTRHDPDGCRTLLDVLHEACLARSAADAPLHIAVTPGLPGCFADERR